MTIKFEDFFLYFENYLLDKIIGTTTVTKHYCQYRKDISLFRMITFTQTSTKQVFLTHTRIQNKISLIGKFFE